jgi:anti-sigma factor (TIGR02949 family)
MTEHERMECEEVIAHLLDYLDGEIDAEKRARIDRHLEACRGCYSRAEFERALRRRIRELGMESAPEALRRRLKALLEDF